MNQTRFSSSSWWPTVSLSLLFLCCLAMSLDGEMSKLDLCPASVHKADKKNLLVALFKIVPTPQHTNEPTMVSATPRNTEMICLQQCRKDVLKYKPPKNFYYFLINLKILGIAFIDIHIFVEKKKLMWSRDTVVNSAGVHRLVQKLKSVFVFITPLNLVLNQNFLNLNYSKVQRLISEQMRLLHDW